MWFRQKKNTKLRQFEGSKVPNNGRNRMNVLNIQRLKLGLHILGGTVTVRKKGRRELKTTARRQKKGHWSVE